MAIAYKADCFTEHRMDIMETTYKFEAHFILKLSTKHLENMPLELVQDLHDYPRLSDRDRILLMLKIDEYFRGGLESDH